MDIGHEVNRKADMYCFQIAWSIEIMLVAVRTIWHEVFIHISKVFLYQEFLI